MSMEIIETASGSGKDPSPEVALAVSHKSSLPPTTTQRLAEETTTDPVQPGDFNGARPEFGRVRDVTRLYGLRRGTIYNLLQLGKIKGVLLRVRGRKSGVRLFDMQSVREFIVSQMGREATV
jgi:hypothetical protein